MADNVEIRITGAVDASLPAATAAAETEITSLGAAAAGTGTAMKGASLDYQSIINASTGVSRASTSAKDSLLGLAMVAGEDASARRAAAALTDIEGSASHMTGSVSTATREFRALFDELSSGRTRQTPGTLAIIAQRVFGLGPAALGAVAGIGILVGGIAYLEYESLKARKNLDDLTEGFKITGRGSEMTGDSVAYTLGFLSKLPGSTSAAADGFLHLAAEHASWSRSLINDTGQLLPAFIRLYGKDAPEAVGKLTETLSNLTIDGFQKLDRSLLNLKPEEYELIENLIKTGSTAQAVSRILADLAANSGIYIKSLGDQVYDIEQKMEALDKSFATPEERKMASYIKQANDLKAALAEVRREESTQGTTDRNNHYKDELDAAQKITGEDSKRVDLVREIGRLQADQKAAAARGDTGAANTFGTAAADEQRKLTELDKSENEKQFHNFVDTEEAKAAASKAGSAARIAAAQAEMDKAKALFGDQSNEYMLALGKMNAAKREAAAQAASIDKHDNTEFLAELNKEAAQINQIRSNDLATELRISKIGFDAEKSGLDAQVAAHKITAAQKYAILADLAQKEADLDIRQLQFDQSLVADNIVAYTEYANKIKEIRAQLTATLGQLAAQETQAQQQELSKQQRAWIDTNREVMSSEDSLVSGIFQGRQRLRVLIVQAALDAAEKEVAADLRYWTERELLQLEGISAENATERGGVLMNLLFNNQKTASTAVAQGAQTSAVVAGVGARTAAEATGATAGLAIQKATGSVGIVNDAKQAAANTYAAVSAIPVIGPILAPVAAGTAFAAVMAFDTLTSAEGGQYNVPFNNQLTALHVNEQVLPATYASGLRNLIAERASKPNGAGGFAGAPGAGHQPISLGGLTLQAMDAKSFLNFLNNPVTMRLLTSRIGAALAQNPSYRPNY